MANNSITVEVKKRICTLATYPNGAKKELRIVEWCNNGDRYDIRDWWNSPEYGEAERMSRGITLRESEARALMEGLVKHFGEEESK